VHTFQRAVKATSLRAGEIGFLPPSLLFQASPVSGALNVPERYFGYHIAVSFIQIQPAQKS
jgi:hypothetical protein